MPCRTYEFGESPDGQATGPCDELEETDSLLVVHLLHHLPEPVDLLAVFGVVSVDGVLLPVGQINLLHPAQHQLEENDVNIVRLLASGPCARCSEGGMVIPRAGRQGSFQNTLNEYNCSWKTKKNKK